MHKREGREENDGQSHKLTKRRRGTEGVEQGRSRGPLAKEGPLFGY